MSSSESALVEFLSGHRQGDDSEPERAAIYARTSSVNQRFGYSLNEQVRQCWERCEMLDWDVTYVFRDGAESGKDTDRPMFQTLLAKAEAARFDVVVFWRLDRLSRSIMHAVQIEKQLRDLDIALHSITEQLDTTTAAGRFNFRNIANAAEFEHDLIKQRTRIWDSKRSPSRESGRTTTRRSATGSAMTIRWKSWNRRLSWFGRSSRRISRNGRCQRLPTI